MREPHALPVRHVSSFHVPTLSKVIPSNAETQKGGKKVLSDMNLENYCVGMGTTFPIVSDAGL